MSLLPLQVSLVTKVQKYVRVQYPMRYIQIVLFLSGSTLSVRSEKCFWSKASFEPTTCYCLSDGKNTKYFRSHG